MRFDNWKPWALMALSAGSALIIAGNKKIGFGLLVVAGILFEIANALNGGKYFD